MKPSKNNIMGILFPLALGIVFLLPGCPPKKDHYKVTGIKFQAIEKTTGQNGQQKSNKVETFFIPITMHKVQIAPTAALSAIIASTCAENCDIQQLIIDVEKLLEECETNEDACVSTVPYPPGLKNLLSEGCFFFGEKKILCYQECSGGLCTVQIEANIDDWHKHLKHRKMPMKKYPDIAIALEKEFKAKVILPFETGFEAVTELSPRADRERP